MPNPDWTTGIPGLLHDRLLPAGTTLIRQGEADDSLYIVVSGRLRVSVAVDGRDEVLADCGPDDIVGEIAFLTGRQRSVDVTALEATRVLQLSRPAFGDLERTHPDVAARISSVLSKRLRKSQLGLELHRSHLFGDLDPVALADLEADLESVTLQSGEILCRQGEPGDALFLIIDGRLRVTVRDDGGDEHVIAELGRGDAVGELAVLGGERRAATVVAVRDTNLARLSRASFERHSTRYPHALGAFLTKTMVGRFQHQGSAPARRPGTINTLAVVAVSPGLDLDGFSARLSAELSRHGRSLHLSAARFDQLAGLRGGSQVAADAGSDSLIVQRLAVLEADHRYVVYQTDGRNSAWSRRSVRQADHVVLVGRGATGSAPADLDDLLRKIVPDYPVARTSLVLIQDDQCPLPSGTAAWLRSTRIGRHYHVRETAAPDYERLARVFAGQAVGLVLGGGFARGLGHAGVIRALAELGIPVDFVGGTSMGGIVAAQVALGWSADTILERCHGAFPDCFRGDLTIPMVAFLKGRRLVQVILRNFGDIAVEDLWLPCFAVASSLTRSEVRVIDRGSLTRCLLATAGMPGMYPPVVSDGELLVDGGLLDNVPTGIMKEFSNGAHVIAVNVSPRTDPGMTADYGLGLSGWAVLANRLNPFATRRLDLPSLPSILMRAMTVGDTTRKHAGVADVFLMPPLAAFPINAFDRGAEMADVAYQFARPRLAAWQAARRGTDAGRAAGDSSYH